MNHACWPLAVPLNKNNCDKPQFMPVLLTVDQEKEWHKEKVERIARIEKYVEEADTVETQTMQLLGSEKETEWSTEN